MVEIAAIASIGLGLALANYRAVARRYGWAMGHWHKATPLAPLVLGLFCFLIGLLFAASRGLAGDGLIIVVAGIVLAIAWIAALRGLAQVALIGAPIALVVLIVGWTLVRAPG